MTSGGKEVYVRNRVTKRLNGNIHRSYSDFESRYNSFFNKWDFCKEFSGKSPVVTGFLFDSSSDDNNNNTPHFNYGESCKNTAPRESSPHQCFKALQMFSPKCLSPLMPSRLPSPRTPPQLSGPCTLPRSSPQHHQPESADVNMEVVGHTPSNHLVLARLLDYMTLTPPCIPSSASFAT